MLSIVNPRPRVNAGVLLCSMESRVGLTKSETSLPVMLLTSGSKFEISF